MLSSARTTFDPANGHRRTDASVGTTTTAAGRRFISFRRLASCPRQLRANTVSLDLPFHVAVPPRQSRPVTSSIAGPRSFIAPLRSANSAGTSMSHRWRLDPSIPVGPHSGHTSISDFASGATRPTPAHCGHGSDRAGWAGVRTRVPFIHAGDGDSQRSTSDDESRAGSISSVCSTLDRLLVTLDSPSLEVLVHDLHSFRPFAADGA